MLRKVAAGTALGVAMLALGSVAGAQHSVTSTLPAVTVDAAEGVAVSDNPLPSPPADAGVGEAVTAADQIGVFPPTNAGVDEAVRASDLIGVFPPTNANVDEAVTARDQVGVFPPVDASVAEAVVADDRVIVAPSALVNVGETIGVTDNAVAVPPVVANASEPVGVTDTVGVALNSAPSANAGGPYVVDEGRTVRLNGTGIDPEGGPLTFRWSPSTHLDDPTSSQPTYSAPDDSSETLTLTTTDEHGLTGSSTALVTVRNVAPVLTVGGDAELPAGSALFRAVSFTDPGADTWSGSVDFGDGSGSQPLSVPSRTFVLSHVYAIPGTFTVRVSISDDDGGSGSASFVVHVLNTAPRVSAGGDITLDEGATLARTGTITDTPDTWSGTVDYGDGGGAGPLTVSGSSFSLTHVYRDNGDYAVRVTVSDAEGATGTAGFTAHVRNVAPIVGAIAGAPADAVRVGATVTLHASFTDPGSLDTHTSAWRWGDGSMSAGTVASGGTSATHAYTAPGVYSVTVSVTDDDGGVGISPAATVLVYNPQAGSVVGGGTLAGPAAFAIAVRNSGGTTRGTVQLVVWRGLLFHADSVDWLVTSHGCALTAGHGRLDGRSGFSFGVIAVQTAGSDRFRIRIWNTATGAPVFDTSSGPLSDCTTAGRVSAGGVLVRDG